MYAVFAPEPLSPAEALIDSPSSLAKLSAGDRVGDKHRDGWGIGWYDEQGSHVVRSAAPACDDPKFAATARSVRSPIILAHVRDASVGVVREENSHPFVYGPWMFCHNGTLENFDRLRPSFERETLPDLDDSRRGDTDSEHLFLWILSNLAREGFALTPDGRDKSCERVDVDGLFAVVRESLRRLLGWAAAAHVAEPKGLNLMLTDGRLFIAVRYGRTLWTRTLPSHAAGQPTIVVASESTDERGPWREADDRSILTVDAHGRLLARPT
jgi:glutamine amidotransferase